MNETGESGAGDASETSAEMAALRRRIDALDVALVELLARRQREIEQAAGIKSRIGWPARIPVRVDDVLARVLASARRENLSPELATRLWTTIVEWSIGYEERLMGAESRGADATD